MLDVHILTMPGRAEARARCITSVMRAADASPYPVFVHVVPGIAGHLGNARARGFSQGNQPFVTFVDDDDFIDPQAFAVALDFIATTGAQGVTTGETIISRNGVARQAWGRRHHLAIYRRDRLIDLSEWECLPDQALMKANIDIPHLPKCLYFYSLAPGVKKYPARSRERYADEYARIGREFFDTAQLNSDGGSLG